MGNMHLDKLRQLLQGTGSGVPHWLEQLVLSGPQYEQCPEDPNAPNRMRLTEFLAGWLKDAGVSHETAIEWLLEYCFEVLGPYSKSSPSGIRHGTKAMTRYVYQSGIEIDFEAIVRDLPDSTFPGQPVYLAVYNEWEKRLQQAKEDEKEARRKAAAAFVPPVRIPVKHRYRDQFDRSLELAMQKKAEGLKPGKIVTYLNEQGYLTRTGRKWTLPCLTRELAKENK
jgi:hypothetical protein